MSLILDALRKSEAERRRGEAPGLFTALPSPGARAVQRRSPLPWLAVVALVIAIAAAAWWWNRAPVTPASSVVTPAPVAIVSAPAPPPAAVAPPPVAVAAPPIEEPKRAPVAVDPLPPKFEPPAPPPPPEAPPAEQPAPLEALPTLAALDPSVRAALPPLKLSMHVWSEAPNARLAIIDGQRVMEGAAIGESVVAEIRPDGVVLEVRGRRYLLPRP